MDTKVLPPPPLETNYPALLHTFICQALPLFTPASAGTMEARSDLTIQSANACIPLLARLSGAFDAGGFGPPVPLEECFATLEHLNAARELGYLLNHHGSDKASSNNYHDMYAPILADRENIRTIVEIGLGTNNTDVVSNMGSAGRPGASLRAFRDFAPNAQVFGADVDTRILFEEERIRTCYVDQTDLATFEALGQMAGSECDLIIDDGLHAPHANLAVLLFAMGRLRPGGWVIIEDIPGAALPLWQVAAKLMRPPYRPHVVRSRSSIVFAVQFG